MLLKTEKEIDQTISPITHFPCLHKFHFPPLSVSPVPLFSITLIILSSQKEKKRSLLLFIRLHPRSWLSRTRSAGDNERNNSHAVDAVFSLVIDTKF